MPLFEKPATGTHEGPFGASLVRFLSHVCFGRVSLPSAELYPIQDHSSEVMGGDCTTKETISELLRMDAMSARRRVMVRFPKKDSQEGHSTGALQIVKRRRVIHWIDQCQLPITLRQVSLLGSHLSSSFRLDAHRKHIHIYTGRARSRRRPYGLLVVHTEPRQGTQRLPNATFMLEKDKRSTDEQKTAVPAQ